MKVTTLIMWDMTTGEVLRHEYHDYSGTWELAKGDDAAAEQQKRANDLQQQALDMQKAQINKVNSALNQYINGKGQGFDPAFMAAVKSQFLDQNAAAFNSANSTLSAMLQARGDNGGDNPVGGTFGKMNSSLLGQEASSTAGGIRDINVANLQQMLANRFNAASIAAGIPATLNGAIGTFGSMSSNALASYIQAKNTGFGATFGNTLGQAAATGAVGGLGKVLSNTLPNIFG